MNRWSPARYSYHAMLKRVVRTTIGVILVLLGLMALFTPLTPGSWLVPIGLEILGLRILLERRVRAWAEAHPNSRAARAALRFVSWRPRGWVERWRRRYLGARPTGGPKDRGAAGKDEDRPLKHDGQGAALAGGPEGRRAPPKDKNH